MIHQICKLFLCFVCICTNVHAERNIVVGLLSDVTGPSAPNGLECKKGYDLAINDFGNPTLTDGSRVKFIFDDHKGQPKDGVNAYQNLKAQGAIAIVSNRGNVGMALDALSLRDGTPLIGAMGHAKFIDENPNGFRIWPSPELEGGGLATWAIENGFHKVAVLTVEDEYIRSMTDEFEKRFKAKGGSIVYHDSLTETEGDFSSYFIKMRQRAPDLLFLNATVGKLGVLIKKAREQGLQQQIISNFWLAYPEVALTAGTEAKGSGYLGVNLEKPKFLSAYKNLSSGTPSGVTFSCYAALKFVLQGIKQSNAKISSTTLLEELKKMQRIDLPDGAIPMRNREAMLELTFSRIP